MVIANNNDPQYIQGVNGAQAKQIEAFVFDGGGTLIANPPTGVDNVQIDIVGGAVSGERLSGFSAAGVNQQGNSIKIRTNRGDATFSLQSGTRAGFVTLRATTDRADGNVDNGITDPVTSTRAFTISDGKLFDIDITTDVSKASSLSTTGVKNGPYQMTI